MQQVLYGPVGYIYIYIYIYQTVVYNVLSIEYLTLLIFIMFLIVGREGE